MSFKVLGITAGRKDSNSEILLKEALLACKQLLFLFLHII